MRSVRCWLNWGAGALVIALSVWFLNIVFGTYRLFFQAMPSQPGQKVIVSVSKSMPASLFVRALRQQHLIDSPHLFLVWIRLQGLSHALKAGVYQLKAGESAGKFLYRVVEGDVLKQSFRIIEGSTQAQVSQHLAHAPYLSYQEKDWSEIASEQKNAEGLLLADTYQYDAGSQSKAILETAHANLVHFLEHSWQTRSPGLPYHTAYELLIAASILEKETAQPTERYLIAGVIVNRLRKHMPLQMDPTVIYALGTRYQGSLSRNDLQVDSPYNTYRYRGLPPTPIAMVSKEAIESAAHPTPTEYLYFVAKGDGSHCFSATYEQQKQAIIRYMGSGRKMP